MIGCITTCTTSALGIHQFTVLNQADRFLRLVKFIESIRQRLSPGTGTTLDEIGIISADDLVEGEKGHVSKPLPDSYWNLSAALYGYIFNEVSHLGIDAVGMSTGLGYPNTYYPSVTMMDWKTGQPNARYWMLKLLIENTEPGDKQVETECDIPFVEAQAYVTPQGKRRILLVNKRDRPFAVEIAGTKNGEEHFVDQKTGFQPAATRILDDDELILQGLEVSVTTLT
jgi:hypothetical protein